MVTVTDSILANVTLALKKRGMWNRTLVIHLSDNGGPVTTLSPPLIHTLAFVNTREDADGGAPTVPLEGCVGCKPFSASLS